MCPHLIGRLGVVETYKQKLYSKTKWNKVYNGKVNFGFSDSIKLYRQVLENGEMGCWSELIFILLQKVGVVIS